MSEKSFFNADGISVTSARVVIGGQTYAMSGITSVRSIEEKPSRKGPIILGVIGIIFMLIGQAATIVIGLIGIALAVFWFISIKPIYHLKLVSASGESDALSSKDAAQINKIVSAINEAIISRG